MNTNETINKEEELISRKIEEGKTTNEVIKGDVSTATKSATSGVKIIATTMTPNTEKTTKSGTLTPKTTGIKARSGVAALQKFMQEVNGDDRLAMEQAVSACRELKELCDSKNNLHAVIKTLVVKVEMAISRAEREYHKMSFKLAQAEDYRGTIHETSPVKVGNSTKKRKIGGSNPQTPKTPLPKVDETKWKTVSKKVKEKKVKIPSTAKKPKVVRPKADALAIGINGGKPESFSDVLKKIRSDPSLLELGEQVSRIRKSRNGEMLIEFRADSTIKSTAFKELVEKSVGEEVTVKALTQEIVLECVNMDEITTGEDLRAAIKKDFGLEDNQCNGVIRMRKAYGATQIGTIKMPITVANKLLKVGKVRVGWSVCSLRISQQPLRCFKCLGFGHQSKNCKGPDRSKACWKCGMEDHKSKDCKNAPKCLLCAENDGNKHPTGSLKCKAYKEAVSKKAWK
jgi:hypothetical protein